MQVEQALILVAGLQDGAHLRLVGFQLRGSLRDPQFQDFVQLPQILLGLLGHGDVVRDADEADVVAGRIPARLGFRAQPAVFARSVAVARFQHERLERSLAGDRFLHDPLLVVRVKPFAPVERDGFLERQSEKVDIGLVGKGARAVELGDPHRHRCAVCDEAKTLLAFAQLLLGQHPVGGVDMGADQPQRASLAVAFELGDDVDPARLAVARPHDAIGSRVVLVTAGKRVEKLFDRAFAVLGMDARDPVFVGFVGRIRRQAVDDEIFRRAAILEAFAEVDLDAADAPDALDPRQFRLAFLQGAMSPVALVRNFLQMLLQAFSGGNFRQDVRSVRLGHAPRYPLPALSHGKRRLCQLHLLLLGGRQL